MRCLYVCMWSCAPVYSNFIRSYILSHVRCRIVPAHLEFCWLFVVRIQRISCPFKQHRNERDGETVCLAFLVSFSERCAHFTERRSNFEFRKNRRNILVDVAGTIPSQCVRFTFRKLCKLQRENE